MTESKERYWKLDTHERLNIKGSIECDIVATLGVNKTPTHVLVWHKEQKGL